ncbi:MAG: hypothetical protein ACOXZ5_04295 [Syntrophomonadaceae bacterium]|jgi:hypothetical protein
MASLLHKALGKDNQPYAEKMHNKTDKRGGLCFLKKGLLVQLTCKVEGCVFSQEDI